MQMPANTFRRRANEQPEKELDKEGVENKVWVVPAPFCAEWYNKNERWLLGDTTLDGE